MKHAISEEDVKFRNDVESCAFPIEAFDHRAHLRLAYTYLADRSVEQSYTAMKSSLQRYLVHNGIDPSKYHETITRAWILAVDYFLSKTGRSASSDDFIDLNPVMLDSNIMLTHYSKGLLFSEEAKLSFVEPDLDPIPNKNWR